MEVKCQCGSVSFKTPTDAPIKLYHCHCTHCRRQSGSAYGTSAIFTSEALVPLSPELEEKMSVWSRPTGTEQSKATQGGTEEGGTEQGGTEESEANQGGMMECYFCKVCGNRVMHRARDSRGSERGTVSIKAGWVEGLTWEGGVHIHTSTAVVPVPEGAESWEEGPE